MARSEANKPVGFNISPIGKTAKVDLFFAKAVSAALSHSAIAFCRRSAKPFFCEIAALVSAEIHDWFWSVKESFFKPTKMLFREIPDFYVDPWIAFSDKNYLFLDVFNTIWFLEIIHLAKLSNDDQNHHLA